MHSWPNLDPEVAKLRCEGDAYLKWFAHEKARLAEDWTRDTSRLIPDHLQPLIYKREAVIDGIRKSRRAKPPGGGMGQSLFVADFVIGEDGLLRIGYSHTRLSEVRETTDGGEVIRRIGMPVYAAGQFEYGGGLIHKINNGSGHYKPSHQSPAFLQKAFDGAGLRPFFQKGQSVVSLYREPFTWKR